MHQDFKATLDILCVGQASGPDRRSCCAGKTIVRMSQYIILAFGLFMGVMAIILLEIGLSLG